MSRGECCGDCGHGHEGRCGEFGCRCMVALPPSGHEPPPPGRVVVPYLVRLALAEVVDVGRAPRRAAQHGVVSRAARPADHPAGPGVSGVRDEVAG